MTIAMTWPCAALHHADLAARTTMRVGGSVEWLLEPAAPEELRAAVAAARELGHVPRILGGGANLILADGELPGVVITTSRLQRLFRVDREGREELVEGLVDRTSPRMVALARDEGFELVAWAGVSLPKIVSTAARLGWSGVEGLAGVPGNVGGGVAMNAGGRRGDFWDVVERVLLVDEQGAFVERVRDEVRPSYRNGNVGACVVASAVLRFRADTPDAVRERGREYLLAKNRVQPVTEWSAGCIFKNPPPERAGGASAGQLIERCGLKGRVRGDAIVSPLHGNFIVNRGRASAADVLTLIDDVHDRVLEATGVELQREVKVWAS
jgi:UDP-N-acetylmuramate dehydrogenase